MQDVLSLFSILAPHFASEMLEKLLDKKLEDCHWPQYDPKMLEITSVTFAVQVNGKLRGTLTMSKDATQEEVQPKAQEIAVKYLEGKEIIKVIFIKNRMISFVVK